MIESGTKAPYTGLLFTPEKAREVRVKLIEGDEAKALNESYVRSIDLYRKNESLNDQKVNILLEQNDKLSKSLNEARGLTSFEKIAYFVGGILLSAGAVYGASRLQK